MKNKNLRKIAAAAAFLVTVSLFSSCNRGYGCPNNFSMNDQLVEVVFTFATERVSIFICTFLPWNRLGS